jgi:hypothetical protein
MQARAGGHRVLGKVGWQPIDTAPINKDVMLIVTDGHGEPYAVFQTHRSRLGQL